MPPRCCEGRPEVSPRRREAERRLRAGAHEVAEARKQRYRVAADQAPRCLRPGRLRHRQVRLLGADQAHDGRDRGRSGSAEWKSSRKASLGGASKKNDWLAESIAKADAKKAKAEKKSAAFKSSSVTAAKTAAAKPAQHDGAQVKARAGATKPGQSVPTRSTSASNRVKKNA